MAEENGSTAIPDQTLFQQWMASGEPGIETPPETTEAAAAEPAAATKGETEPDSEPEKKESAAAETGDADDDKEKLPKGLKKRFRTLTGKIRDLETQLAKQPVAGAPVEPQPGEVKPAAATPPGKPVLASFDTYEDFMEALTDWKADQRDQKRQQDQAASQFQTEWQKRIEDAKGRYEDWDEVVEGATDVPVTPVMQQAIFEMERGPDVVHYLASNPKEADRISKLTPLSQARELGKIEDRIEGEAAKPKTEAAVSKTPKPPKTVSGAAATDLGKEPDPKDFKAWNAWQDRQEALANR